MLFVCLFCCFVGVDMFSVVDDMFFCFWCCWCVCGVVLYVLICFLLLMICFCCSCVSAVDLFMLCVCSFKSTHELFHTKAFH